MSAVLESGPVAVLRSLRGQTIPLKSVDLSARAEGLLFELSVEQRYANAESESIEAVYTFPLPSKAVLLSFELEIGERRLKGTVSAKREASERYEQAIEGGDAAALLEQAADGLYTVNLGNLKPGETAVIRYRYAELLAFEQGRLRIAIPTVVAPRYGVPDLDPQQVPESDLTARYPCTFRMELAGALARARFDSPSHGRKLKVQSGESLTLVSSERSFSLDRDLVILLDGLAAHSQSVLARDGDGYVAIVSLVAPKAPATRGTPRALKLVVDCSGSMQGDSIAQAREAMLAVMHGLNEHDHVSVTRFGSTVEHVTPKLEPATPATLARLNGQVRQIEADLGGTEMQSALQAVLRIPAKELRADVLLITDGEIWDVEGTIGAIAKAGHRLFVVAVGAAPNEAFAAKIAQVTGGACEFVTPHEDVRAAVGRLLARMGTPPVTVQGLAFDRTPTWVHGVVASVFPGDTCHVFAGFNQLPSGPAHLMLDARRMPCELPTQVDAHDTLARVAAMARLKTLPHAEAVALAERYQLVTEYTSCVVVLERADGEKADGMPALRTVPQELAAGWGGVGDVLRCVAPSAMAAPHMRARKMAEADSLRVLHRIDFSVSTLALPENNFDCDLDPEGLAATATPPSWADALADTLRSSGPLPTTLDQLRTLGVPDDVLTRLGTLIDVGVPEDEVVVAWLALQLDSGLGDALTERQRRRISRAAQRGLIERVKGALAVDDELPF